MNAVLTDFELFRSLVRDARARHEREFARALEQIQEMAGIDLGTHYLHGMNSALAQADRRAAEYRKEAN